MLSSYHRGSCVKKSPYSEYVSFYTTVTVVSVVQAMVIVEQRSLSGYSVSLRCSYPCFPCSHLFGTLCYGSSLLPLPPFFAVSNSCHGLSHLRETESSKFHKPTISGHKRMDRLFPRFWYITCWLELAHIQSWSP